MVFHSVLAIACLVHGYLVVEPFEYSLLSFITSNLLRSFGNVAFELVAQYETCGCSNGMHQRLIALFVIEDMT